MTLKKLKRSKKNLVRIITKHTKWRISDIRMRQSKLSNIWRIMACQQGCHGSGQARFKIWRLKEAYKMNSSDQHFWHGLPYGKLLPTSTNDLTHLTAFNKDLQLNGEQAKQLRGGYRWRALDNFCDQSAMNMKLWCGIEFHVRRDQNYVKSTAMPYFWLDIIE